MIDKGEFRLMESIVNVGEGLVSVVELNEQSIDR